MFVSYKGLTSRLSSQSITTSTSWTLLQSLLWLFPTTPPSLSSPTVSFVPSLHGNNVPHLHALPKIQSMPLPPVASCVPSPPSFASSIPPPLIASPPPLASLPPPVPFAPPPPDTLLPPPPSFRVPLPLLLPFSSERATPPDEWLLHPWGMVI